jgi:hypothetical protein
MTISFERRFRDREIIPGFRSYCLNSNSSISSENDGRCPLEIFENRGDLRLGLSGRDFNHHHVSLQFEKDERIPAKVLPSKEEG